MRYNLLFRTFMLVLALGFATTLRAQSARILKFEQPTAEIGRIKASDGKVKLRFVYTNIADTPVSILTVHSQCGCAVPEYSKEPVDPGKQGVVEVTLDPKELFGEQKRGLTVVATNGSYRKFNTLVIHGYVEGSMTEEELRYPNEVADGLRSDVKAVGMRLSRRGETPVRSFTLCNTSGAPMRLNWSAESRDVTAEVPAYLAPGAKGEVTVRVNTASKASGPYTDTLLIRLYGEPCTPILLKGAVE